MLLTKIIDHDLCIIDPLYKNNYEEKIIKKIPLISYDNDYHIPPSYMYYFTHSFIRTLETCDKIICLVIGDHKSANAYSTINIIETSDYKLKKQIKWNSEINDLIIINENLLCIDDDDLHVTLLNIEDDEENLVLDKLGTILYQKEVSLSYYILCNSNYIVINNIVNINRVLCPDSAPQKLEVTFIDIQTLGSDTIFCKYFNNKNNYLYNNYLYSINENMIEIYQIDKQIRSYIYIKEIYYINHIKIFDNIILIYGYDSMDKEFIFIFDKNFKFLEKLEHPYSVTPLIMSKIKNEIYIVDGRLMYIIDDNVVVNIEKIDYTEYVIPEQIIYTYSMFPKNDCKNIKSAKKS